jgi:hypothetical protein
MEKKTYGKPELKTHKIDLGVFGDYGNGNGPDDHNIKPVPIDVIRNFDLHME